jgi:hypothetical protein
MKDLLSISLSILAFLLSLTTFWLTMKRGILRMTKPAFIGFLYDLPVGEPKVFFRAMLFATGRRGPVVESLFLRVRRGDAAQTFNFWMFGEIEALKIGSGIRVTEEGVAANHHFLPPMGEHHFEFLPGDYELDIYARIVRRSATVHLQNMTLHLTQEHARTLKDQRSGVFYLRGPDSERYIARADSGPRGIGDLI